jgi:hypothetical protein
MGDERRAWARRRGQFSSARRDFPDRRHLLRADRALDGKAIVNPRREAAHGLRV